MFARAMASFVHIYKGLLHFVVVVLFCFLSVKKKKKPELRVSRSNNGHWNNGAGLACSRRFLVAVVNHGLKLSLSPLFATERERERESIIARHRLYKQSCCLWR